ncbi:lysophospholipase [Gordonia sp. ABSL1-1]|uniref:alpha/beta hydrolase n=1 Tax=Gordonia sp. ABSL1-1 TaxID=3053923 RepID=UPI0025723592|nr:lysophospholipase [Gordonia sp. ABSL1-1]MDL9937284.1 lysophospholipase [Gordonia sp. ABSL1-1]
MTSVVTEPAPAAFDEPTGLAARGTLIVLTGRGESAATYGRLGRRLSADAYRVRIVETGTSPVDETRSAVAELLADDSLPAPKIVVGSDRGANLALELAPELDGVDAAILVGLLPRGGTSSGPGDRWEDELELRTACPTHRGILSADPAFTRGTIVGAGADGSTSGPVPADDVPTLVLHGADDRVAPWRDVLPAFTDRPGTVVRLVTGGRHDVLNDVSHRSVAATIVLFLESLKIGPDLAPIVTEPPRV